MAFGGGFYAEATFSFTGTPNGGEPTPSFWANDVEHMAGGASTQWQGQANGYDHWGELDIIEANVYGGTGYGGAFHDDFGILGVNNSAVNANAGSPFSIGSASFASSNKIAALWVPATATSQGYLKYFFNEVQVGKTVYWNQYDPATPPIPVNGVTTGSIMDARHWALILGNSNKSTPMKVSSLKVWQASSANNLSQ